MFKVLPSLHLALSPHLLPLLSSLSIPKFFVCSCFFVFVFFFINLENGRLMLRHHPPQDSLYQCFLCPEVAKPFCLRRQFAAALDPVARRPEQEPLSSSLRRDDT